MLRCFGTPYTSKQAKNEERMNELDKKIIEIQTIQKSSHEKFEKKDKEIVERIEKLEKSGEILISKQKSTEEEIKKQDSRIKANENSLNEVKKGIDGVVKEFNEIKTVIENNLKKQKQNKCPNGIFNFLFDKCNGNPVDKGLIKINGNSRDDDEVQNLPNIIDKSWNSDYWLSKDNENSYIKIDFNNMLAKIYKYHIFVGNKTGQGIFNSWILKGTTEDNREIVLDTVNNSQEITQDHPEATISIQNHSSIRSIQLIMKGDSSYNDKNMRLRNIELFGDLESDLQ